MAFIKTVSKDQAEGLLAEQYQAAQESMGYVPHYVEALSLRPEVYEAWTKLIGSIRSKMRLRRYELVTLAAASALDCTYCMLAHGAVLRKNDFSPEQLVEIARDFRSAGLPPEEVAIMSFAQKVATQAHQVDQQDIEELRRHGLSDEEILDVVLATAARSFFSKALEALGAVPDRVYLDLEPELLQVLSVNGPSPQ
jgi:uncharacterized peroxidase-related enzyme